MHNLRISVMESLTPLDSVHWGTVTCQSTCNFDPVLPHLCQAGNHRMSADGSKLYGGARERL
jgi:hypothetical protein